jgi:hypothetical protein
MRVEWSKVRRRGGKERYGGPRRRWVEGELVYKPDTQGGIKPRR